jgi:hypothetical protein
MAPSQEERLAMLRRKPLTGYAPSDEQPVAQKEIESQSVSDTETTIQGHTDLSTFEHTPSTTEQMLSISDEDDDYVAAFASKAASKPLPVKKTAKVTNSRHASNLTRPTHPTSGMNSVSRSGDLPASDSFGHPATGHFCGLKLTTIFPYKYMGDTEGGKVSQRFFAHGKFYERTWDV